MENRRCVKDIAILLDWLWLLAYVVWFVYNLHTYAHMSISTAACIQQFIKFYFFGRYVRVGSGSMV